MTLPTPPRLPPGPRRTAPPRGGWLRVLVPAALVGGGTSAFVGFASEVGEGETRRIDEHILLALRNRADLSDPWGPRWLEEALRDVTGLGGVATLTLLTLATVGFLVIQRHRWTAAVVAGTVAGGLALSSALKHVYARPRPDLVPHGSFVYTSSFPSGHAAMSAVTFLTLAALLAEEAPTRALRVYLLSVASLLTLAVGFSRVYLGVHYPSDVLAGWIFGATWSAASWFAARHFRRHRQAVGSDAGQGRP
ncbi:MAG: phosphatase PAP2 family protein [Myxococcaceae bacterium]|nr:MAG: phosphatase PAP2 family protein [Myxococcaceae bacterium]